MAAAKPSLHPGTAAAVAAQAEGTAKQKRERQQRKSQSGAASSGSCGASGGSTGRKSQKAQPSASAGAGSIDVNDDAESAGGSDRGASRGWADREMLVMLHVYEAQLKAEAISFRQNTLNGNNMNWDAIALRTAELSGLLARSGNACNSARVVLAYQKKSTGNGAPWWQLSEDDRKNWADPRGFKDYKLISEKVFEEVCRVGKHNNAVEPVDVTTVGGFGLKVATSSQKGAGDSNAQGAVPTVSAGGGVDAVDLTAEKEEVTKKPRGGSAASSNQDSDSEDKEQMAEVFAAHGWQVIPPRPAAAAEASAAQHVYTAPPPYAAAPVGGQVPQPQPPPAAAAAASAAQHVYAAPPPYAAAPVGGQVPQPPPPGGYVAEYVPSTPPDAADPLLDDNLQPPESPPYPPPPEFKDAYEETEYGWLMAEAENAGRANNMTAAADMGPPGGGGCGTWPPTGAAAYGGGAAYTCCAADAAAAAAGGGGGGGGTWPPTGAAAYGGGAAYRGRRRTTTAPSLSSSESPSSDPASSWLARLIKQGAEDALYVRYSDPLVGVRI
ncbi:hypothetical protein PLESTM_000212500 [Pleodorina starrii]|nr:hypothetical protein PLESTM_000212500 [Pleodorina starrii]